LTNKTIVISIGSVKLEAPENFSEMRRSL